MNREKLLDVVKAVESVPEAQFEMRFWWRECKTTGCGIGHYCHQHPEENLFILKSWPALRNGGVLKPRIAIALHFDISYDEADFLFRSPYAETKSQFIGRLLKFIGEEPATVVPQLELVTV